jgi:hypothetical protein
LQTADSNPTTATNNAHPEQHILQPAEHRIQTDQQLPLPANQFGSFRGAGVSCADRAEDTDLLSTRSCALEDTQFEVRAM